MMKNGLKFSFYLVIVSVLVSLSCGMPGYDQVEGELSGAASALTTGVARSIQAPQFNSVEEALLSIGFEIPQTPETAPDFTLTSITGEDIAFGEITGDLIFLNIWYYRCNDSIRELPTIQTVHEVFADRGLNVHTVPFGGTMDYIRNYVQTQEFSFTVVHDPLKAVKDLYQVPRGPVTFLINKDQQILGRFTGFKKWDDQEPMAVIEYILSQYQVQPEVSFYAENIEVPYGESTVLKWTSKDVLEITASGDWDGSLSLSGTYDTGELYDDATFVLTAKTADSQIITKEVTISVLNGPGEWEPDTLYQTGDIVLYNGIAYECRQTHTSLTGWEPAAVPALWLIPSVADEWHVQTAYTIGDLVSYEGVTYKCVMNHVAMSGWFPSVVPALWTRE